MHDIMEDITTSINLTSSSTTESSNTPSSITVQDGIVLPNVAQVWYNYSTDGGDIIPPVVQVELSNPDIAQQFNQQVAQYESLQAQMSENSKHDESSSGTFKSLKSRSRSSTSERVICPQCGKSVSCNATLRDHMRTHTGERPFVCGECGLAFAQRSNLRMHKRLHTGERPYMCGICGKTFARSSHLPAHMRTHTGEKPFVCKECGNAFITSQQLKNHFRVHTGEKPWKCDLCTAAFTHSSSLSTHKKKHSGDRPYQCEKCSKTFFFSSALEKHLKVHSKNRPFKCDTCEKAFKYKESLTVHKERYCGKEALLKTGTRLPRNSDAKKPGPKPGSGRKYIQKRKGRPRGRPRKKKWNRRISKNSIKEESFEYEEEIDDEENEEALKNKKPEVPEIKVEVTPPEQSDFINGNICTAEEIIDETGTHCPQQIHIDDSTHLTIVSSDGCEQPISNSVHLVALQPGIPLQIVSHEQSSDELTHEIVTREGVQMWYPRPF